MLRRSHLPLFSKPPEGNGTTLGTTSRPSVDVGTRVATESGYIYIPVISQSSRSPTLRRPHLHKSLPTPRRNSSSIHLGVGKTTVAVQGAPRALVLPHTSTPALVLLARRRLSYTPALPTLVSKWRLAYQAKILIQIARSLFRFAWDWVRRRVIGPLENLMRRMGWRVEATLTARLNITTRSGDVFNQSLPLRLALPHNVVAAPGEGAEQV
ncbi:hypothetical protein EDB85DRAFT_1900246 [Lactarius pseudohatsudake]|nr:hypothetical protein EDB85DRAFT_1900246 [Lactarius pseudohatsudake]